MCQPSQLWQLFQDQHWLARGMGVDCPLSGWKQKYDQYTQKSSLLPNRLLRCGKPTLGRNLVWVKTLSTWPALKLLSPTSTFLVSQTGAIDEILPLITKGEK
eukprot:TRINITY_DN1992_c0_g1_i1.p1 TRINITY_DN1992_c0_g1~~TRINITY_DN1992_c0_g1_i1.p1  ORF type:complete len:102 (-),score=12.09 TRINITY_DN1992_c0_g1_i1:73-378(-)